MPSWEEIFEMKFKTDFLNKVNIEGKVSSSLLLLLQLYDILCRFPAQVADLFIDMGKGTLAIKLFPALLVRLHGEPEHGLKVLPGQSGLCIKCHKAVIVNGMTLQNLLYVHTIHIFIWTQAENKSIPKWIVTFEVI